MPLGEGLVRVFLEPPIVGTGANLHPSRLRSEHHVGALRRHRQLGIDGRSMSEELDTHRFLRRRHLHRHRSGRSKPPARILSNNFGEMR